jgi:hypothetical protein
MSLDGLRAWIGEVERKLGVRTRVFLALVAIAVGGAGAAIYLALDTRDQAVDEDEVQRLQEQIDGIEAGAAGGADSRISQLELEIDALKAQLEAGGNGATGPSGGGAPGEAPAGGDSAGDAKESSGDGGAGTPEAGPGLTPDDLTPIPGTKDKGKSDPKRASPGKAAGAGDERTDDKDR